MTNLTYKIKSKYLFGCDGARSQVLRQLKIPLVKKPGQGLATNVLVKVDLSHVIDSRMGNLHQVMRPDEEHHPFAWATVARMVKPWNEYVYFSSTGDFIYPFSVSLLFSHSFNGIFPTFIELC